MSNNAGSVLYLIPVGISDAHYNWVIPTEVINQVSNIQYFIVENAKSARHFIKSIHPTVNWNNLQFLELDKHNPNTQLKELGDFLEKGEAIGLMSEAGLPCIADPGNLVVRLAHEKGIRVKPLSGPSSIILALISSGLNGQNFRFNGYLPGKPDERKTALLHLEKHARETTQLFIEAPYRNNVLISDILKTVNQDLRLLIAYDITGPNEFIQCKKISLWKKQVPELGKTPCMFAIGV